MSEHERGEIYSPGDGNHTPPTRAELEAELTRLREQLREAEKAVQREAEERAIWAIRAQRSEERNRKLIEAGDALAEWWLRWPGGDGDAGSEFEDALEAWEAAKRGEAE